MGEVVVLPTARYWLDEDRIIHGVLNRGVDYRIQDAMEMMELHRKLGGGRPCGLLMDITAIRSLPHEVRTYFMKPEHAEVHRAVALLVGSPLSRMIGNFFLGLNRPAMPMRLFSDEALALEWLRGLQRT